MPPETPLPEKSLEQAELIAELDRAIDVLQELPILKAYIQARKSYSAGASTSGFPEDQLKKLGEVVRILGATPEGQAWEQTVDVRTSINS